MMMMMMMIMIMIIIKKSVMSLTVLAVCLYNIASDT